MDVTNSDSARKEIWEGRVAVSFALDEKELNFSSLREKPEPVYMVLPRVSYFPLIYDKLDRQFRRSISDAPDDQLWLEYGGKPLKWHYPAGVLYDLTTSSTTLLWTITVHYKDFPSDVLLHCPRREVVEAHFKSKIKEADCLKHRKEVTQIMKPQEFEQLWTAYLSENYSSFWEVNSKLMANARGELEPFKYVPFIIYQNGEIPIQRLIDSVHRPSEGDSNKGVALPADLSLWLKTGIGADNSEVTLRELILQYCPHAVSNGSRVIIHGVQPSLDTPLLWLSRHFSYPDNFIHICVLNT